MRKRVFSLVELLVVLAVMAVILTLSTSTLNRFLERTRRFQCAGNLRQMNMAAMIYTDDFAYPPAGTSIYGDNANGNCSGYYVTNNHQGTTTGWWVFVEQEKYLPRKNVGCPSMDVPIHYRWPNNHDAPPFRYSYSYRYNFHSVRGSASNGYYVKNPFEKYPARALFFDAAGYRHTNFKFYTKTVPASYHYVWAHKDGGQLTTFDGRVVFMTNKFSGQPSYSWPTQNYVMHISDWPGGWNVDDLLRKFHFTELE